MPREFQGPPSWNKGSQEKVWVGPDVKGEARWLSPIPQEGLGGDGTVACPPSLAPDLARGKVLQALDGQLVHGVNLVVVGWVSERERQQALLLQVGFWKAELHSVHSEQGSVPISVQEPHPPRVLPLSLGAWRHPSPTTWGQTWGSDSAGDTAPFTRAYTSEPWPVSP